MPTAIKDYKNVEELIKVVTPLLINTSVEMGLPLDEKFIAKMSIIFSNNLRNEVTFNVLNIDQITISFSEGVRFGKGKLLFNIRTFYRWVNIYANKINKIKNIKDNVAASLRSYEEKVYKATQDRTRNEDIKKHEKRYPSNKQRQDKKK